MGGAQLPAVEHGTDVTPAAIMQLGTAYRGSKVLLSAVELGVFSELAAAGKLDSEELCERVGLHPRSARDFFDTLVALGMLEREDSQYANTAATDLFLDRTKPSYLGEILKLGNARYEVWGSLTEALRTGLPQIELAGSENYFAMVYADPARTAQYARAMSALSAGSVRAIVVGFPWQDYRSVIDIGCAEGALPVQIALAHEHITCGGFDLPAIGPRFDAYVAGFGLSERVSFIPGDFFTDPLPTADVLVMGHLLHGWDIDKKQLLLRKAYDALPENGALIVYDGLIDDERRSNTFGLLASLHMLLMTPGGANHTGADYCSWMQEIGFRDTYVEHLAGPESMVVGIK